jgi:predicted dehydrogenase
VLHASVLVAARLPRFVVHGQAGSWIKHGLDAQEGHLIAALTPGTPGPAADSEHAVLVDGVSGAETATAIPRGDYRQFYIQLREAVRGAGNSPVPPAQALAVMAVVETAIRSSAEGRALALPLTEAEVVAFKR